MILLTMITILTALLTMYVLKGILELNELEREIHRWEISRNIDSKMNSMHEMYKYDIQGK